MNEEPTSISINAVARMPSARLKLADLEFFASAVGEARRVVLTWSSREMRTVTASNFSAQSPSIKVVRTFHAKSIAEFATRAPRGKKYIMEARVESSDGIAVLTSGNEGELSRNLILRFDGTVDHVPSWFDEIVKEIVSAKLLNAGQREFYLLCLAWVPVFLPPIVVPWAVASGRLSFGALPLLLMLAGVAWIAYTVWTPTIARFIRASSLRVTPLFTGVLRPQTVTHLPLSDLASSRIREFRAEAKVALKSGWSAFRQSDHQFNAVLIAIIALVVSVMTLIVEISN
jgi:hypothetical protein